MLSISVFLKRGLNQAQGAEAGFLAAFHRRDHVLLDQIEKRHSD